MNLRRAQPSESRDVRAWIAERHYTRSAPPGYLLALEFVEGRQRIGAMLLGRPAARAYRLGVWMELSRMFFIDETPAFTESRALAMMRKHLRIWHPRVRMLVSYSDPGAGHEGIVYEADGWAEAGMTRARKIGWENRPGRRGEGSYSRKTRWLRTP